MFPAEIDSGDSGNEDVSSLTVTELITSLKSAFQKTYFSQVEEVLVSREEKLKKEIEAEKKKNELLQEKLGVEVIEKIKVERECIELKRKICQLQCEKLTAETELEIYKKKYEELEMPVLGLEEDIMLPRVEPSASKDVKMSGEASGEKAVNGAVSCENGVHVKIEMDATANLHSTAENSHSDQDGAGNRKSSEIEKVDVRLDVGEICEKLVKDEVNGIDCDEKAINETTLHRNETDRKIHLPEDVVEIIDSDDESAPGEISSAGGMLIQGRIDKANPSQTLAENLIGANKRKWTSLANKSRNCDGMEDRSRDVNDNCPTGKPKMTKVQEHFSITSPFQHFSEDDDSSSSSDSDELDLSVDNAIYKIQPFT